MHKVENVDDDELGTETELLITKYLFLRYRVLIRKKKTEDIIQRYEANVSFEMRYTYYVEGADRCRYARAHYCHARKREGKRPSNSIKYI